MQTLFFDYSTDFKSMVHSDYMFRIEILFASACNPTEPKEGGKQSEVVSRSSDEDNKKQISPTEDKPAKIPKPEVIYFQK